jgi:hypothetical protein
MDPTNRPGSWSTCALHVAALASFAIAQPLLDSLGTAPEFLLAHDLGPGEILAVAAILAVGIPVLLGGISALVTRMHAGTGHLVTLVLIAASSVLIALHATKNLSVPPLVLVGVALATGAAIAVAYHRFPAVRSFSTWLAPGIVIFPVIFLLRPGVQSLLWPGEQKLPESSNVTTPVVLVVFDGLPLTSLLDENRVIDRELYPSFAALADESTWYRNATTVSDFTRWAVPSILSGQYPRAAALPLAADHPDTIFSLLGASHAVRVLEPISRLCPQTVCDYGGEGVADEMTAFAGTLAVAYLHAIAPARLEETLPPINHGWAEGIPPSEKPGEVWLKGGEQSRRGQAVAFVDSIEPDSAQPSFHFLHVLLPHTPLAYMPGGQRYGTERSLPGLLEGGRDRWLDDEWAVTQGYRRFLLQVGYVDTLLGHIINRLKEVGLYDRALLVVTSDHGASFQRGQPFRRVNDQTYMDILPVPLFIKTPGQQEGQTSDRNVESVDILPTMADVLKVTLPWRADGVSAIGDRAAKASKTVFYGDAKRVRHFQSSLLDAAYASVDRKLSLFGTDGNYYRIPTTSPHRELIGRDVDELRVSDATDSIEFALDVHGDFANVRPESRFVPAHLAGRARWRNSNDPAVIAVAVNGTVQATTRTYTFRGRGAPGSWSVVLPPDSFHAGENDIDVFVVRSDATPVLHRAHFSHAAPVNLLSDTAAYGLRVSHGGLYEREGEGQSSFRWTNGNARIVVPREGQPAPQSLRVNLASAGPQEKGLLVRVNGCDVFDGKVPTGRWSRIFAIKECGEDDETVIQLLSSTHQPSAERALGVAVERLDLLDHPWPPPATPLPESDRRSHIRLRNLSGDNATVKSTDTIAATVANRGTAVWPSVGEVNRENGIVRLGVLWFRRGDTRQPAAVQRVELPRTLVPGDSVDLTFQLKPAGQKNEPLPAGEYEAWLGVMQEGVGWFYSSGDLVRKLRVVHSMRPHGSPSVR